MVISCRRNDLLRLTLSSFKRFADVARDEVYVIEDSENTEVQAIVRKVYPNAIVVNNLPQVGHMKPINVPSL